MRVLFISGLSGRPECGGTPTVLRRIGAELERNGHRVEHWFAEDFPPLLAQGSRATVTLPPAILTRLSRAGEYDVLDISSGDGVLYLGLHRLGLLRRARAVVVRSHGSEHLFGDMMRQAESEGLLNTSAVFRARFYGVRLRQVGWSLRLCDRVICCSHREPDLLAQRLRIPREKFTTIPHGVGEEFRNAPPPAESQRPQVIFAGNWVWNKGTRFLGPVFREVRRKYPAAKFVVAGAHVPADLVRAELPEEIRPALEVFRDLSPADLARKMAESSLMLFPSDFEGFGLVAMEAMALGVPVVMSRNVGLADWFNGDAPAAVVSHTLADYTQACLRLLADDNARRRLGQKARTWASAFTWKVAAGRTLEAYQMAMEGKGGSEKCR